MMATQQHEAPEQGGGEGGLEPMAGDIALLVPVEKHWRVLDLTDAGRAASFAPWTRHTVHVRWFGREAGGRREGSPPRLHEVPGRLDVIVADRKLPFRRCSFDLVILDQSSSWSLGDVRRFLRVGGWLIWIVGAYVGRGGHRSNHLGLRNAVRAVPRRILARLALEADWRRILAAHQLTYRRAYVHFREYAWGFLPYDAPSVQRYYLEAIQEEGVGLARGRARVARLLGRLHMYRYFASTYVVVARAGVPR